MNMHSRVILGTATLSLCIALAVTAGAERPARAARNAGGPENRAARKAEIGEKVQAAKEKRQEVREKTRERREELQDKAEQRIDKRQDNQAKRIEHGINKGYLTAGEISKLEAQQQSIANLETTALADGKLTRTEFAGIRAELNEASRCIWSEKHDTEGNQMPTYRLGKNVFAKDAFTAQLQNENLDPETARALLKDFRRLVELKRRLATEDLSDADRAALQAEYDNLLNLYFEVR